MRGVLILLLGLACAAALPIPTLEKDNPSHRDWSTKLDNKFSGGAVYDKAVRPIIHGTYHTGRYIGSGNSAEWARAKDQFSKVGTGQQRTEYLKEHEKLQQKNSH